MLGSGFGGWFGSRGAAEFIATRVVSVLIFGGLLVACGGSETSSDLEAEESQFGSSTEQAELPEGPFGEVAVDLSSIIKPTDNVGGEVQNYIDFPDVHTPEGTDILGLELGMGSAIGGEPWVSVRVAYAADGADAETVFEEINSEIEASSDWEMEATTEPSTPENERFLRSTFVVDEPQSTSSQLMPSSGLVVMVQQRDGGPVTVDIQKTRHYVDQKKWEGWFERFVAWRSDIPSPQQSIFFGATLEVGYPVNMGALDAIETDLSEVPFNVKLSQLVERDISTKEMEQEIVDAVDASDDYVVDGISEGLGGGSDIELRTDIFPVASFSTFDSELGHEFAFEGRTSIPQ